MSKKGSREERELVNMLWEADCAAMRAPASGGATKKPLPDVNSQKIDALCEFSDIFGAKPYVGAKFKREKWRFVGINDLVKTKKNNYRLDKDLAFLKGIELEEMIGRTKQFKF